MSQRIGLLGGALDPVHLGHIQIAKTVLRKKLVDKVWLLPCYQHMFGKNMTPPEHRLEMCRLAVENIPDVEASDLEIVNKFDGKAYDFITKFLYPSFPKPQHQFHFIIGMDNALKIEEWYRSEEVRREIGFIVFPRVGQNLQGLGHWFGKLPHIWCPDPIIDISSTKIRNWVLEYGMDGMEIARPYIDDKVADYIKQNNLYGIGD